MSYCCPHNVSTLSLSCSWPHFVWQNPNFVHINPSFCPKFFVQSHFCPFIALIFTKDWDKNCRTKPSQRLASVIFYFWHLVTLQQDKKWTIFGLEKFQSLSTYCPKSHIREMGRGPSIAHGPPITRSAFQTRTNLGFMGPIFVQPLFIMIKSFSVFVQTLSNLIQN